MKYIENQPICASKGKKCIRVVAVAVIAADFDNLMIKRAEQISNQSNMCKQRKHLRFEAYLVVAAAMWHNSSGFP